MAKTYRLTQVTNNWIRKSTFLVERKFWLFGWVRVFESSDMDEAQRYLNIAIGKIKNRDKTVFYEVGFFKEVKQKQ